MSERAGLVRHRWRARWLTVHAWLGLSLGGVLALLGLTGSALVFYTEIDAWLNPAPAVVHAGPTPVVAWAPVLESLQRANPDRPHGWRIELIARQGVATARYLKPVETQGAFFAPLLVSVEVGSARVLSQRFWGDFAMTWVYDLHYTLLTGALGRTVVGVVGLIMLVSLGTGLALWWPRSARQWAQAWRAKPGAGLKRRTWDWHRLSGLYASLWLGVLGLTGAALALPEWVDPVLAAWSPSPPMPKPVSTLPAPGAPTLLLDVALAVAQARFPHAVPRWVDTPGGPGGVFRVRMAQPDEPGQRFPRTYVWVDAYRPQVLASRDAALQPGGERLMAWVHPLHNGEVLGLAGRLGTACVGMVLPLLWVTGLMRWRDRWRGRQAVKRR